MKGTQIKSTAKNENERNDAASVVASLFKVTPRYVRLVIKDRDKLTYKGEKPNNIREVYAQYVTGKTKLITAIEKSVKVA